jgi:hypothetical protein
MFWCPVNDDVVIFFLEEAPKLDNATPTACQTLNLLYNHYTKITASLATNGQ